MDTPKFGILELESAQSQPEVVVNEGTRVLEAMSQLRVLDKDTSTPPSSPEDGDAYIVPSGATGAWLSYPFHIAISISGDWFFVVPQTGYLAYVVDEDLYYQFTTGSPSGWEVLNLSGGSSEPSESIQGIDVIGISSPGVTVSQATALRFTGACEVSDNGGGVATVEILSSGTGTTSASGGVSNAPFSTLSIVSNTITLNLDAAGVFEVTLTANVTTVNIDNVSVGKANFFTLKITQDGTGGRTFAVPASWKVPGGGAFVVSSGAGETDLVQGISYDNGATWLVSFLQDYS